ncbi:MAG: DUF1674 domain-containing protein [Alphaproteobacteria bacterium]|nr:DUF1674 domain-containing protein [Alphaproteobacteria bacterium]
MVEEGKKPQKNGKNGDKKPGSAPVVPAPKETGGPEGPEPTRYGDWERKGRVSDF